MKPRPTEVLPEKRWVGRSFGAAAARYDGVAALQRSVGTALLSRLSQDGPPPAVILDAGAGTGHFSIRLKQRHPQACVIALDLSEGMLRTAQRRFGNSAGGLCLGGDAETLPLANGSVDLVFSNLTLQWCHSLAAAFGEFRRILRPGRHLCFSTFGPATLVELRHAWAAVDGYCHVNDFPGAAALTSALATAGFAEVSLTSDTRRIEYPDVIALMRELKALGAHNVTAGRRRHLTGKDALRKMMEAYPRAESGWVGASFEALCVSARAGLDR